VEYRTTIKGVAVVIDLPGVTQAAFDAVGDYLDLKQASCDPKSTASARPG